MAVNIWISFGSILYGSPTRTLPPGPVHNCSMARSPQPVSFNYTINMTSPSFDHTSKIGESNYLTVEDAVRGVWGTTDSLSFAKNTSGQTLTRWTLFICFKYILFCILISPLNFRESINNYIIYSLSFSRNAQEFFPLRNAILSLQT